MNSRIGDRLAGVCAFLRVASVASGIHVSVAAVRRASLSEIAPRDLSQIRDVLVLSLLAGGILQQQCQDPRATDAGLQAIICSTGC